MGPLFSKSEPKPKDETKEEDNPKKNDNPDNNPNTQNNDHNFNSMQNEKNNQENSNTNESFIDLKPGKINNSLLISRKKERESSHEGKDFSFGKKSTSNDENKENEEELMQKIEEERKKMDILYEKLEILRKKSKEGINTKILQENKNTNNNLDKNELLKSIRNIIKTTANKQKDIKERRHYIDIILKGIFIYLIKEKEPFLKVNIL